MSLPSAVLAGLPQEPLTLTAVLHHLLSEKVKGDLAQLSLVSLFPQGWYSKLSSWGFHLKSAY